MIEYLNFIRPEKFAIIKHKKSNIIIFKNFNLKNKIIFFNKKFKYINHSEEHSFLLSNDKFFIEISKNFKWYRFINKFGICEKKINTFFKFEIEDIKINTKTNEIIILDNKSNICFFDYTNNQIILKKKLNLPIKFSTAKFDFIDFKKIFICIDNRKIIFLENLKDIKFSNIFKNARNITSLRIFNKKIILVDQRNYCLHIFNLEGKQQKKIGSKGTSIRNFDLPSEMNMFGNKLLVSDQNNDRFLVIDKNFKFKIFKKRIITKSSLSRPIKSLIINKFIYILDRENYRIQVYSLKLDLIKSHNLVKIENAKPNSFCFNSKLNCFFILYRKSNFKNILVCYDQKLRKTFKKQISTNDAQDISCFY